MSSLLKYFLLGFLALGLATGCTKKEEEGDGEAKNYFYDPRVPFGDIYSQTKNIKDVTNLQADISILHKIKLTWKVPPLYTTLDYNVVIFKRRTPPPEFNIVCPDPVNAETPLCPADESSAAVIYKVKEIKANQWVDENYIDPEFNEEVINVAEDTDYTYWVFVKVDKSWSNGVRIDVHSKAPTLTFKFPEIPEFWKKLKWSYGQTATVYCSAQSTLAGCQSMPPAYSCAWNPSTVKCERQDVCSSETTEAACTTLEKASKGCSWNSLQNQCYPPPEKYQSMYSLDAGTALPGEPKGGIAFAYSGNVIFISDTNNNRVMIYQREGALQCETYEDPYEQAACMLQYAGAPLLPTNVLGQAKVDRTVPCGDPLALPANQCMVKPSRVLVQGNRLLVSDSGNNRILVYNSIPLNGCDPQTVPGQPNRPTSCLPSFVIGKAGLSDMTNYSIAANGDSALNNPSDLLVKENDLYIADTGNNRIIKIQDYADDAKFLCTADTWGGGLCRFSAVLGQEDFFSRNYLEADYALNSEMILTTGLQDTFAPGYENYMRRHFREPIRMMYDEDGKFYVGTNERFSKPNPIGGRNSVHGRILIFNNNPLEGEAPTCNPATFNDGACDAADVVGQARFDKLENASGVNPQDYNQLAYGMFHLNDFDIKEIPPDEEQNETETKRMLLAVDGSTNGINVWLDLKNKGSDGYPRSGVIVDPQGAMNPTTQQAQPDLQNICSIRVNNDMDLIYVHDCAGFRLYEIQAYKIPGIDY